MAIQVDWAGTSVTPGGFAYEIYIPKADLTLVQASPEIRELDINPFLVFEPGRHPVAVDARVILSPGASGDAGQPPRDAAASS